MEELEDVREFLPPGSEVEELRYEASDIVIYTSSREFFLDHSDTVKKIVSELKKRVEVRPSGKLFMDPEKAEERLYDTVSDQAGVENVIFQPSLGKMIIRAENPGEVIGDRGSGLQEIREKTLWAPQVERVPAIDSKIVDRARELTVEDPEFRKEFLHDVGQQIRLDKTAGDEWVRISSLGGFRQVGRSCVLVQTEESNVLMDAGINPSAEPGSQENYPYLNAPELDLQELDAVVLSHAHMDHCLTPDTPVTMADGSQKPIAQVEKGDRLKTFNWDKGKVEGGKCLRKKEVEDEEYLEIETSFNSINASGDHRFFIYKDLKVQEVRADELEEGDWVPEATKDQDKDGLIPVSQDELAGLLSETQVSPKAEYLTRAEAENLVKELDPEISTGSGQVQISRNLAEKKEELEKLLEMDVEWHRIRSIETKDNDYGYLVDLKVSPNENFIAEDQVVHNCGMIPYLYKMGYDGPLYCTKPTRDLMIMLTLDYIGIAHSEQAEAPYDSSAIKKAVKRTITPDFGEVTDITPDMRLTLKNSGHILGSSLVHLHVGEGLHNILYTGDYNYDQSEMLRPADTNFKRVETLITESTYGGRDDRQQPREEAQKKFLSKVKQTLNKGGKVIVPVFAVGRSQEILGLLADELDRDYFDYNVYLDGMIKDANALHTAYPDFLSKKVQKKVFQEQNSPFTQEQLHPVGSHEERQDVFGDGPCVILTTSGMLTGGPVLSYLQELAPDEKNAMIFVGYQASGTLGNRIQQGRSTVQINDERVDVNLDVSTVSGFSAHSDRQQIINYCKNLRSSPNKVLCNHGEEKKCFSLSSTLHKVLHIDTEAPQNLDVTRVH